MFNSEMLGSLAAKAVSIYLTKQVPLTDAVVSISKEENLNIEQTKRLVEATNQVAYLKILETAKDRTFSFDLADLDTVLASISTPDVTVVKSACVASGSFRPAPLQLVFAKEGHTKQASSQELDADIDLVPMLPGMVAGFKHTIESGGMAKQACAERIVRLIEEVKQESYLLSKIAAYKPKNADLVSLVGEAGSLEKTANQYLTFKAGELKKVAELDEAISELKKIASDIKLAQDSLEKVSFMAISGRIAGSIFGRKNTGITNTSIFRNTTAERSVATNSSTVKRGYQSYPGQMAKSASATDGGGLPSPSEGFKQNFRKGLLYKVLPKNKTFMERVTGLGGKAVTVADYGFMRETIAPKHSVWDSLHNTGG